MARLIDGFLLLSLLTSTWAHIIDETKFKPEDIIVRDVAIVGGGASGTYAAVRLKDQGKTIALIERDDHLGGHVNTYTDPVSKTPIDYGVLAYLDLPGNREFFSRFNVSVEPAANPPWQNIYADFTTGKVVPNYPSSDEEALGVALGTYAQVAAQYNDYIFPGLEKLAAGPIPEDLSMTFGNFVRKYNLSAAVPVIWTFTQGTGDILNAPTAFVMRDFGAVHVQNLLAGSFFVPSSHNNSQLYGAALQYLADDSLLSSKVSLSIRDDEGVKLVVKSSSGEKLVKAKKLIITIPPTKDNMYPFDFDKSETEIFSKWQYMNSYVAIFSGSDLPDGLTIVNTSPDPSAFNLPTASDSFLWRYYFTGTPGLYQCQVVAAPTLGKQSAKDLIRDGLRKLNTAGTFATKRIDFVAFADHNPIELRVSQEDLVGGFYGDLYGLQGKKSTWFTGQAWASDYTSILWLFTETSILPAVMAA